MFDIEKELKNQMKYIRRCCAMFCRNAYDIDSLQSEVAERIWAKRHQFKGDEKDFNKWAFVITRSLFINNYRHAKKYTLVALEDYTIYNDFDIEADMDYKQLLNDILFTIERKFRKIHSDIFRLHVIEGYKIYEVAEMLGVPDGTVKNVAHTIRKYISKPENIKRAA